MLLLQKEGWWQQWSPGPRGHRHQWEGWRNPCLHFVHVHDFGWIGGSILLCVPAPMWWHWQQSRAALGALSSTKSAAPSHHWPKVPTPHQQLDGAVLYFYLT